MEKPIAQRGRAACLSLGCRSITARAGENMGQRWKRGIGEGKLTGCSRQSRRRQDLKADVQVMQVAGSFLPPDLGAAVRNGPIRRRY